MPATTRMLAIESLCIRYPGTHADVVVDVALDIAPGTALGLVGESGSGKSTVAKAIVGLAAVRAGRVLVDGVDVTNARRGALEHLRATVQMVFQDPNASLHPRMTVGDAVGEAVRVRRRLTGGHLRSEVERLLDLVGLQSRFVDRYPFELSGGQRQRVAIARALAPDPKLLLLDEPTASLDVSVQATVLNLLRELRAELGLTYLAISHDLAVIHYLCENVAVMQLGSIKEAGPTGSVLGSPRHHYTAALLDAVPRLGARRAQRTVLHGEPSDSSQRPSGCSFHLRCPVGPSVDPSHARCATDVPVLEGAPHAVACHFPIGSHSTEVGDIEVPDTGTSDTADPSSG